MLRKWIWIAAVVITAGAMGEVCTWTGAGGADGVGAWSSALNWQDGKVPGSGDTAVFGAIAAGNAATVSVNGDTVLNIRFTGADAPAYNFTGASSSSMLNLENHGFVEVADSVVNDQTFSCKLATVFTQSGTDTLAFTNFSATARLKLGGAKWTNGGSGIVYLGGTGKFEFAGQSTDCAINYIAANNGSIDYSGVGTDICWRPKFWMFNKLASGSWNIHVAEGAEGLIAVDGGGNSLKGQAVWKDNALVEGPGVIPARLDNVGYPFSHQINGGVTVTFNTVLTSPMAMATTYNARLDHSVHFTRYPDNGTWTDRIAVLNATNVFAGPLMISGNVVVRAAKFGVAGCDPAESNIGSGSEVIFLGSGGTLDYTGAGETCDRGVHCHQVNERWDWSSRLWPNGYTMAAIRNSGTGALTLTGEVNAQEEVDAGATKELNGYPTNCLFKLDGANAPVVFAGSTGGNHKFAFETAGTVTLKTFPANFTNLILNAAVLTVDSTLGGGSMTVPALRVNLNSVMKVPHGYQLDIGSLAIASGKTLDLVMDDSAQVILTGATEGELANVTINGAAARCNASGRIIGEGTAWKAAADGRWADENNWNDGLPSTAQPGRVNLSGDFTITLDSTESIGDFSMNDASGRATLEVSGSLNVASGSKLTLGQGSELKVTEGGEVTIDTPQSFTVRDGGRITVTGGVMNVNAPAAYACSSTDDGVKSSIETKGGSFTVSVPSSSQRFTVGNGFTLGGNAGTMTIKGAGTWYQTLFHDSGTDTNRFSGTAYFALTNNTTSLAFASNGRWEFSDNARLSTSLYSAPSCFMPYADGHTLEFEFKDHAAFGSYAMRTHGVIVLGCPSTAKPNGVTRFILDSDADHYARCLDIGVERTCLGELVQKRGTVHLADDGLTIGTFWESYWINGSANRGIYRIEDGVLDIVGGGTVDNKVNHYGLLVGWGMHDGYTNNTQYTNYRFHGRFEQNGGTVTNTVGIVAVGAGRADGELVQCGGTFVTGTRWSAQGEAVPANKSYYPGLQLVGGFTGTGLWAISNGTVKCESAYEHTYVGGVDLGVLKAHIRRVAQGSSDGSDSLYAVAPDAEKTASGRLEVVAGTLSSKGDLIVGARGHGEVALIGNEGGVTYRNLVLSNNVESVARFVMDANGVKPINLTGTASVAEGAKLVIDVTGFTGRRNRHPLIVAAGGMTGRFADVTLVGDNLPAHLAVVEQDVNGVRLIVQRGMRIILR